MKRRLIVSTALAAAAVAVLAGCSTGAGSGGSAYGGSSPSSSSGGASTSATSTALATASSPLGTIVVNGSGMTVYVYDKDTAGAKTSACTGACVSAWPAVNTTSSTPAVSGVTGTVATIVGVSGAKQVTLNGLPLYTFAGDAVAGTTKGQGLDGTWWVVSPSGAKISGSGSGSSSGSGQSGY